MAPIIRTLYGFGEMTSENWQKKSKRAFFETSSACKCPFWIKVGIWAYSRNAGESIGGCIYLSRKKAD